jgi:hypothetical protein
MIVCNPFITGKPPESARRDGNQNKSAMKFYPKYGLLTEKKSPAARRSRIGARRARFLGKSPIFGEIEEVLLLRELSQADRSTDVCVLLLAVTTADPLAQLEKVAEKFDLPADASFFLKDLCGPTP